MLQYVKAILTGQFEAALCMMNDCLVKCPPGHWTAIIGKYPFWMVAYHTLCFVDLYLSRDKDAFAFRDIHPGGWKEFDDEHPSRQFEQSELIAYLAICRSKAIEAIAAETTESLQGPSGFEWLQITLGELPSTTCDTSNTTPGTSASASAGSIHRFSIRRR